MSAAALGEALAVFDEAALATLASKGLLRRARRDLEGGKAELVSIDGREAVLRVDGEEVHLGPDGPAAARCTCPAPGVCRHRLTAVLLVQRALAGQDAARDAQASPASGPPSSESAVGPLAELRSLSVQEVTRWAGKAALRAAEQLLASAPAPEVVEEGRAVVVRLAPGLPEVRYLAGQGLAGILSKATGARRRPLHVAAVLAVRRGGQPAGAAESSGVSREPPADTPIAPAAELLSAVTGVLLDGARTGLSLAPQVLEERLYALSVSARAEGLPRPSRLLRRIATGVRERRERRFELDAAALLYNLAEGYALTRALSGLTGQDGRADRLRGTARRAYEPLGGITLYGLGVAQWRTASGASGVTGHFYHPETDRWYSASLARGHTHDLAFNPRQAYETTSLWAAGSLAELGGAEVRLEGAEVSEDGRLSLSKRARARPRSWSADPEKMRAWPAARDDWEDLRSALSERLAPRLSAPPPAPQPVVLLPAASAIPYFDELAQETVWPLRDHAGRWIALTVGHDRDATDLAMHVEEIGAAGARAWVSALATVGPHGYRLRPLAYAAGANGPVRSFGLDRGRYPDAGGLIRTLGRRAAAAAGLVPHRFLGRPPATATERWLGEGADALLGMAELGLSGAGIEAGKRLAETAGRLEGAGLGGVADVLRAAGKTAGEEGAERVLRAVYVVSVTRALVRPLPYLVEG